jgi:hypothetical protein
MFGNSEVLRCQRGNTMMIIAAVMPMLVGAGAVGIDVAQWALAKRHLQRMADTGAIAGANAVMQNVVAKAAVDRTLEYNDQLSLSTAVVVENAPKEGPYLNDATAVRVVVTATPQLSFVSFFLSAPTIVSAEATAKAMKDPRYCMIALEDGPQPGFDFSGSSDVIADCGLMTNSRAKPSTITFGGNSATVKATEVGAVGAIGNAANWASGTQLIPYQAKMPDPYAYAPNALDLATNCKAADVIQGNGWQNKTLAPGCWSGGLSFKTTVTLAGGTYVVKGGTLEFSAGAVVTADGPVTFVLTGETANTIAKLNITANSTINLSAPTSGSLKDILFYQDRRARYLGTDNVLTGNSTNVFNGSFYFPSSNLHFTGNADSKPVCARLVALRMSFTGSAATNISCGGSIDKLLGQTVRLVA